MPHIHPVYDGDPHFEIDPDTRQLKYTSPEKLTIMQGDHRSEIITFDMPRFIDGHDMLKCDTVEIHFTNIDSKNSSTRALGKCEVDDLQISADDENTLVFSWLIPREATTYVGGLMFTIRFICTEDSKPVYVWSTAICTSVHISESIDNAEFPVVDSYEEGYKDGKAEADAELEAIDAELDRIIAIQNGLIPTLTLITFYIDNYGSLETFQAVEGWTFEDWCGSEYDTLGCTTVEDYVYAPDGIGMLYEKLAELYDSIYSSEPIQAQATYIFT